MNETQIQVNREVSTKIRDHLIKQRAVSVQEDEHGTCAYRGANGLMCAVGCLIPDDKYNPEWENTAISGQNPIWKVLEEEYGGYLLPELLRRWQIYHDSQSVGHNYEKWLNGVQGETSPEEFHELVIKDLCYE